MDTRSSTGSSPADGPLKNAIFGANSARLYNYQGHPDRFTALKAQYEQAGPERNLRYGYIRA